MDLEGRARVNSGRILLFFGRRSQVKNLWESIPRVTFYFCQ